jgi:hypothetical protein
MPYEHVREVLHKFRPYVPSPRSICGIIDLVGAHAQPVLEDLPCEGGEVVMIQVDARGMPRIQPEEYAKRCQPHKKRPKQADRPKGKRRRIRSKKKPTRPRRKKGEKAKKTKRVTVGVIYSLTRQKDGSWEGPFGKLLARFGKAEQVFEQLSKTLKAMGKMDKDVVFLSDGAPEYARLRKLHFPNAIAAVDFYHVSEYLWKAGGTLHKEGSEELASFVSKLKKLLRQGKVKKVLSILKAKQQELPQRGPGSKGKRERMQKAINYIAKRVDQMPYKLLRDRGLEIGSGVIESAIRQVVVIRFDGPGMRWGAHRSQLLLELLCLRLSEGWDSLVARVGQWAHQPHARRRMTPMGVYETNASAPVTKPQPQPAPGKENLALAA